MIKQLTKRSRIKKSWNRTCKNDVWILQYRVKSWRGYVWKDRVSLEMYDHRFWDRKDNMENRLSMLNLELWSKKGLINRARAKQRMQINGGFK